MGTGPLNHRGKGQTSNHEHRIWNPDQGGEYRTLNIELRTPNNEWAVPKGRSRIARRFNAGLAALPFKSRRDGRNSRAEIFSIVCSGLKSPAAAGQTRLEFSERGLHWRPAAPGLLRTIARKLVIDVWNFSGAWSLVLGAFRRMPGCWNLELFTPTPLWP